MLSTQLPHLHIVAKGHHIEGKFRSMMDVRKFTYTIIARSSSSAGHVGYHWSCARANCSIASIDRSSVAAPKSRASYELRTECPVQPRFFASTIWPPAVRSPDSDIENEIECCNNHDMI